MDIVGIKEVKQVNCKGLGKVSALGKFKQLLRMQPGPPSCVPRVILSAPAPKHLFQELLAASASVATFGP